MRHTIGILWYLVYMPHNIQNLINRRNTTMTATMAAIFAYDDRRFRYLASFLYFADTAAILLALVSNTAMKYYNNNVQRRIQADIKGAHAP